MTFLGHEDPQPTHDPDPSAQPQDPFVDDVVPRFLAGPVPVARRRTGRRRAVVVGAMATLVVLVGGGSAIAGLIDNSGSNNGRVGAPAAAESSMSPTPSGVDSSGSATTPTPFVSAATPGAATPGAPATTAQAPVTGTPVGQVPETTPPPPVATTDPEPTGVPSTWPTHDGTVTFDEPCSFSEIGWIGYGKNGVRYVCRRVGLPRPHWVPFPQK